tara:strand:+ start:880 stop:2163 length:1284 start_codon:yes stop_codon:yes gene_type:complete
MSRIFDSYNEKKEYYDNKLNIDKRLIQNSNDEPTPIDCVEEMVNKLPESLFENANNKILDPCCGCGNFFLVIYERLRKYHSEKHILDNMLYFNDTNTDRIEIVKEFFCNDKYDLNISSEDFLKYENTEKFDLIVANPPYAYIMENGKRASKNHNMIGSFIRKSFELLKDKGHLLYITPDNWMSCADRNTLIRDITSKQILHLNIHTAKKYFKKIGSSFTWYIIENTPYYKDITVEGIFRKIQYNETLKSKVRNFIPLFYNRIVQSIVSKTLDRNDLPKFKIETSSDLHKYTKKTLLSPNQNDEFKYKIHHTPSQTVWSSRPHKFQDGYKVYIGTTSNYTVFLDGPSCGMTQSIAFIRCESEEIAQNITNILKHPLYKFLNDICRYGNFNNVRILQMFPKCTDYENVYESFGIGEDEQNLIKFNNSNF